MKRVGSRKNSVEGGNGQVSRWARFVYRCAMHQVPPSVAIRFSKSTSTQRSANERENQHAKTERTSERAHTNAHEQLGVDEFQLHAAMGIARIRRKHQKWISC